MRGVLTEQLSSRALRTLRAELDQRADRLVAETIARGSFDAVSDLARRFPLDVVADLVGLPAEGGETLLALADTGFDSFGPSNARTLVALPDVPKIFGYVASAMSRETSRPAAGAMPSTTPWTRARSPSRKQSTCCWPTWSPAWTPPSTRSAAPSGC